MKDRAAVASRRHAALSFKYTYIAIYISKFVFMSDSFLEFINALFLLRLVMRLVLLLIAVAAASRRQL